MIGSKHNACQHRINGPGYIEHTHSVTRKPQSLNLLLMGMDKLPSYTSQGLPHRRGVPTPRLLILGIVAGAFSLILHLWLGWQNATSYKVPLNASSILEKCRLLHVKPRVPHDFHRRTQSDRFVPGTAPTLIKNASIWTGRVSGREVIVGDVLLDKGLIKEVGGVDTHVLDAYSDLVVVDARGSWVSPG